MGDKLGEQSSEHHSSWALQAKSHLQDVLTAENVRHNQL